MVVRLSRLLPTSPRLAVTCGATAVLTLASDYPWMILFQLEPVELSRQERVRLLVRSLKQRVWQLARDREGRPVLVVNILAHGALTWLLVALVQTLRIS